MNVGDRIRVIFDGYSVTGIVESFPAAPWKGWVNLTEHSVIGFSDNTYRNFERVEERSKPIGPVAVNLTKALIVFTVEEAKKSD